MSRNELIYDGSSLFSDVPPSVKLSGPRINITLHLTFIYKHL